MRSCLMHSLHAVVELEEVQFIYTNRSYCQHTESLTFMEEFVGELIIVPLHHVLCPAK